MRAIKPLLLSLSVTALACGAYAADDAKNKSSTSAKPATTQGGSASSGTSGSASSGTSGSASSGASTSAKLDFDKADKNKDGQLSRTEFNDMMKGSASAGSTSSKDTKTPAPTSSKMPDKSGTASK
jgi:hypothetical protein